LQAAIGKNVGDKDMTPVLRNVSSAEIPRKKKPVYKRDTSFVTCKEGK